MSLWLTVTCPFNEHTHTHTLVHMQKDEDMFFKCNTMFPIKHSIAIRNTEIKISKENHRLYTHKSILCTMHALPSTANRTKIVSCALTHTHHIYFRYFVTRYRWLTAKNVIHLQNRIE